MLSKPLLPNCELPFVKNMQAQNIFCDGYFNIKYESKGGDNYERF